MSLTNARAAFPSILSFSSVGSSGTFTDIAGNTQITPHKYSRATMDITDMNSTDYYEDAILVGPVRTSLISAQAHYLSTNTHHTSLLKEAMENGTRIGWKITFAGTSSMHTFYGDGLVTAYEPQDLTEEGKIVFSYSIKPRGKPTGPASSTT